MTKSKRKIEEVESVVMPSGNGAHVMVPKEWLGKRAKTILVEE
jgi:putative transposon-encoded protein